MPNYRVVANVVARQFLRRRSTVGIASQSGKSFISHRQLNEIHFTHTAHTVVMGRIINVDISSLYTRLTTLVHFVIRCFTLRELYCKALIRATQLAVESNHSQSVYDHFCD